MWVWLTDHSSLLSTLLYPRDSTNAQGIRFFLDSSSDRKPPFFFFVNFKYHLIFFFFYFQVQIFTSLIPVTVYAWPATSPFGNISLPDVSYKTKAFATSKVEYYTLRTSTSIDDDEANKSFYVCKWLGNCLLVAKFDTTTQMFFKMLFPCRVKYILIYVRLAWVRTITEQQQLWCLKTGPIHLYQTGSCKQTFSSIWVLIVCL